MIRSLHISNYALISGIDIDFASGFNIITGETGAGKSIILGALSLLLGGRADLRVVRDSSRKSVIEAVFDIDGVSAARRIIADNELDDGSAGQCILRRELLPGGRSRAFINDTPVSLQTLRELAIHLVDIHSQHQNLLLASADYQLDIIDNLAGTEELLQRYGEAYTFYRKTLKEYTDTRELIRRNQADAEFLEFQYNQLAEARLEPGETQTLERERELLVNLGEIKEKIRRAADPLYDQNDNALETLRRAVSALEALAVTLGDNSGPEPDFHLLAERLESARVEVADIADSLSDYDVSLDVDPGRLEEVEDRLGLLYSLETKHHVDNTDELIALQKRLETQLLALEDSDTVLSRLEIAAKRAKKTAVMLADELSQRRAEVAAEFAAELRRQASQLGMPNLRCEITLTRGKLSPTGYDQIQFLFAFNKNQSLLPVGATASGGEISRLMLTIKSIVARRMALPTIIFDEVDTGVSGDIANRMADMMAGISRNIQVITITHLPGVAVMGQRHFKVYKEDDDNTTTTRIRQLNAEERVAEIALMLSGDASHPVALSTARSLLEMRGNQNTEFNDNGK